MSKRAASSVSTSPFSETSIVVWLRKKGRMRRGGVLPSGPECVTDNYAGAYAFISARSMGDRSGTVAKME